MLYLFVRKKTLVPTKRQLRHEFRSDWKQVLILNYQETYYLLNYFNPSSTISYIPQFADYIHNKFGNGEYSIIYEKKGQKGFKSFIHFILEEEGFTVIKNKPYYTSYPYLTSCDKVNRWQGYMAWDKNIDTKTYRDW